MNLFSGDSFQAMTDYFYLLTLYLYKEVHRLATSPQLLQIGMIDYQVIMQESKLRLKETRF